MMLEPNAYIPLYDSKYDTLFADAKSPLWLVARGSTRILTTALFTHQQPG